MDLWEVREPLSAGPARSGGAVKYVHVTQSKACGYTFIILISWGNRPAIGLRQVGRRVTIFFLCTSAGTDGRPSPHWFAV